MASVTPGSVPTRAPAALALRRASVWVNDFDVGQSTTSALPSAPPPVAAAPPRCSSGAVFRPAPPRVRDPLRPVQCIPDRAQRLVGHDENAFAGLRAHAVADGDDRRRQQVGRRSCRARTSLLYTCSIVYGQTPGLPHHRVAEFTVKAVVAGVLLGSSSAPRTPTWALGSDLPSRPRFPRRS